MESVSFERSSSVSKKLASTTYKLLHLYVPDIQKFVYMR